MKHLGTKELETKRLHLRRFKIEDADQMYNNWGKNPNVAKYVFWKPHKDVNETRELLKTWIEKYDSNDTYKWVVELKDKNQIIGSIDVVSQKYLKFGACEIGYCYGEDYWNKGYATEALSAVMKYLFNECGCDIIFADHASLNPGSGMVMKKCGLKYEGTLRERFIDCDGMKNDLLSYSITKKEYDDMDTNNID